MKIGKLSNGLKLREQALTHSFIALLYIVLVSFLLSNGEKLFGSDKSVLVPIAMLSLLVLSAAIMGILIFGKPIIMYLDGQKKEAVKLTIYTIISMFVITAIFFGILFFVK